MGLLSTYRVLDLTDEKGMFATRLLADMGAEVIRIEKPGENHPEISKGGADTVCRHSPAGNRCLDRLTGGGPLRDEVQARLPVHPHRGTDCRCHCHLPVLLRTGHLRHVAAGLASQYHTVSTPTQYGC